MDLELMPVDSAPGGALMVARTGAYLLAQMTDEAFAAELEILKKSRARVKAIQDALMTKGVHYGKVKGIERPFLHQPGAETLAQHLHLVPQWKTTIEWGDGVTKPVVTVISDCHLHVGDLSGPVIGTGGGACTSWEDKYRFRFAEKSCPACGAQGSILKAKEPKPGEEYFCWAKRGGCGAKFAKGNQEIEAQAVGKVENTNQGGLLETILQMAEKRAFVKAVRTATATSDLFTQDPELVGELEGEDGSSSAGSPGDGEGARGRSNRASKPPATDKTTSPPAVATGGKSKQEDPPPPATQTKERPEWNAAMESIRAALSACTVKRTIGREGVDYLLEKTAHKGWTEDTILNVVQYDLKLGSIEALPADAAQKKASVFRKLLYILGAYSRSEVEEMELGEGLELYNEEPEPDGGPRPEAIIPEVLEDPSAWRQVGQIDNGTEGDGGVGPDDVFGPPVSGMTLSDVLEPTEGEEWLQDGIELAISDLRGVYQTLETNLPEIAKVSCTPEDLLRLFKRPINGARNSSQVAAISAQITGGRRVEEWPAVLVTPFLALLSKFPVGVEPEDLPGVGRRPSAVSQETGRKIAPPRVPAGWKDMKASELGNLVQTLVAQGRLTEEEVPRSGPGGTVTKKDLESAVQIVVLREA